MLRGRIIIKEKTFYHFSRSFSVSDFFYFGQEKSITRASLKNLHTKEMMCIARAVNILTLMKRCDWSYLINLIKIELISFSSQFFKRNNFLITEMIVWMCKFYFLNFEIKLNIFIRNLNKKNWDLFSNERISSE